MPPHPGLEITASLTDPDRSERDTKWQWSRSSTRTGSYTNLADADMATYTPTANDVGYYLRATVTYKDREGSGKSAMATSVRAVQAIRSPNAAPSFPKDATTAIRAVIENAEAGTSVGDPVRAADANSDILTHTLHGDEAINFKIDPVTGQITVDDDAELDFETNNDNDNANGPFTVDVIATDPAGMFASIRVTINVDDDMDESPVITGTQRGAATKADNAEVYSLTENVTDLAVATFGATDPDSSGQNVTNLSLSGADAGDFTFTGGALSFMSSPNYERPADADMNNVYKVTVVGHRL